MIGKKNKNIKKDITKVTVVTPVFNGGKYIEETINSVIQQDYKNIEYIIIDGGSSDNTVNIIKKYEDKIDYWVSEKDEGMYDAINKGLKIGNGDILAYLNSDDVYTDTTVISRIVEVFNNNKKSGWTYSDFLVINSDSKVLYSYRIPGVLANFNMLRVAGYSFIYQPAVFWRARVFEESGYFDTGLKMAADYEFFLRIIKKHKIKKVSFKVTKVRFHDATKTNTMQSLNMEETEKIKKKYYRKKNISYFFTIFILFFIIKISNIDNYILRMIKKMKGLT